MHTGGVGDPDPVLEVFGWPVPVPADAEHRPGFRVDQDPGESRGMRGKAAGGVRVDRTVPVQQPVLAPGHVRTPKASVGGASVRAVSALQCQSKKSVDSASRQVYILINRLVDKGFG